MNPVLLLFLLPVLTGLLLLLVTRSERRQQFVQQRLTKITAEPDDGESAPLSLVRKLHNAPLAIFQLPRKFATLFTTAFEAAGNRVGLLHLLIVGLTSVVIVIVFASRLLAVNPALLMPLGLTAGTAGSFLLLRISQASYRGR